jgi:hypothetical protein
MQNDLIHQMTASFEGHAQATENGIEYWLARGTQHLLGYTEWRNLLNIVSKARTACKLSNHPVQDHFVDINKMVELGSGSQRKISGIMLTRYAPAILPPKMVILPSKRPPLRKPAHSRHFRLPCHSRESGNPYRPKML